MKKRYRYRKLDEYEEQIWMNATTPSEKLETYKYLTRTEEDVIPYILGSKTSKSSMDRTYRGDRLLRNQYGQLRVYLDESLPSVFDDLMNDE